MAQNTQKNIYDSEDASGSISPLPSVLSNGLVAVATFGFLSFFSSFWLLSYLTYRFFVWHVYSVPDKGSTSPEPESPTTSDSSGFLVPASALCPQKDEQPDPTTASLFQRMRSHPPNQFLILIYNLLFADIQQAMAFLLNITWVADDSLDIQNTACWAQGWFISTGDLASSVFITAIAVHTYLGVVKNYRLPTWMFYSAIMCCWAFTYGLGILGVIITNNGADVGGLYVRAGAWCWINSAFQDLRLYLHYLWIFISLALTTVVYIVIYFHLQVHSKHSPSCCLKPTSLHNHSADIFPHPDSSRGPTPAPSLAPSSPYSAMTEFSIKRLTAAPLSARHPTFLLYPLIYVLCTAPLAAGRLASMAGNNVPLSYFCFAGSMIASAGWLDVALYASTRRVIVFSGEAPPSQDTGIQTFAFMRTPAGQKFGNVVFVSGGVGGDDSTKRKKASWTRSNSGGAKARLRNNLSSAGKNSANGSKDTLRSLGGFGMDKGEVVGIAIQCETTTTVIVEEADGDDDTGEIGLARSLSR